MKLTKIVVFVGMVGLLAYIHVTAEAHHGVGAAQASPMMIEAGWTIRADVEHR